jgi:hypothetical protein
MRDEYDDRIYQAYRHQFGADVMAVIRSVAYAFDRLHDRLYAAPWAKQSDACAGKSGKRFTAV